MELTGLILGGLALLAVGGEAIVRGAVGVARRLGVSELLIGLTLVGFGTSTPELLTSLNAALAGSPGIAVGNVVGSNISNVLLVLALVVLIRPLAISPKAIWRDGLSMIAVTAAFVALALSQHVLLRVDGMVAVASLGLYILLVWLIERRDGAAALLHEAEAQQYDPGKAPLIMSLAMAGAGLALLILGADLLVDGAIGLARLAGISETVIGLTIVAVGTSLPELVATLVAAVRGRADVAFGNIVGSNLYNLLGILGLTAIVTEIPIPPDLIMRDHVALFGSSVLLIYYAWTGDRITRTEGLIMLVLYGVYCWLLISA